MLKTKGISLEEIKQYAYLIQGNYLCGTTRYNDNISIMNIHERRFIEYAEVLFPNLAEVVEGRIGESIWYVGDYSKKSHQSIGDFEEINDDTEIIEMVKRFILEYNPTFYRRTLLGYKYENDYDYIVNDPSSMTSTLIIGKEQYNVEKYKLSVTIQNKEKKLSFNLDGNEYYKARKKKEFFNELHKMSLSSESFDDKFEMIKCKLDEYKDIK